MSIAFSNNPLLNRARALRDRIFGVVYFILESARRQYPYSLEGEKLNQHDNKTLLQYRVVGRRHIYEMSAQELCNNQSLITKFHPLDVRTISFIAGVEQILCEPEANRKTKFKQLKQRVFV